MRERDLSDLELAVAFRSYLEDAPTQVRPAELARQLATAHPHRQALVGPLGPWGVFAMPRLAWTLLVAALIAALAAGAMVVGGWLSGPRPGLLSPTGIDVLSSDAGAYLEMVEDGQGVLWAREDDGRLARIDPASGQARAWTISDDATFRTASIVPARAGGVWLSDGSSLRLFDGTRFREVVTAPVAIVLAAEAPDGTLWVTSADDQLLHWTGSAWQTFDLGRPKDSSAIGALAVDTEGRPWIGGSVYGAQLAPGWTQPGTGWVQRLDGARWTVFDASDAAPLQALVSSITAAPDGAVWVVTTNGIARFSGSSWTVANPAMLGGVPASVVAGPDGAVWVADFNGGTLDVQRFAGSHWTSVGAPAAIPTDSVVAIAPTAHGVYAATNAGIYRLNDADAECVWPPAISTPADLRLLLAVSRDELWATDERSLWHFQGGAWTSVAVTPDNPYRTPTSMTLAPDGTPWETGAGVGYWRDGRWTVVDSTSASVITVDARGTVWAVGSSGWTWTLQFDGTRWLRRTSLVTPIAALGIPPGSLAVDVRGTPWIGGMFGYGPRGLARYDGQGWQAIDEIDGFAVDGGTVLGTDGSGMVWVAILVHRGAGATDPTKVVEQSVRIAVFDGKGWATNPVPADYSGYGSMQDNVLGPNGTVWAATRQGPARWDGQQWTAPYRETFRAPGTSLGLAYAVTPDGTVFGTLGGTILRFPAVAP